MKRLTLHIIIILSVILSTATAQNMDSLKLALKNAKHDTIRAQIYNQLGELVLLQNPDSAIKLFYESKLIAKKNSKGYSDKSLEHLSFIKSVGLSNNNLGVIYQNKGNISVAINFYKEGLKIQEEIKDKQGIAYSLYNIGTLYDDQGDVTNAIKNTQHALDIFEEIGEKSGAAYALTALGYINQVKGDLIKALSYYEKSLNIRLSLNDTQGIAFSLKNIADVYTGQNQFSKALDYYQRALKIQNQIGDKRGYSQTLKSMGQVYLFKNDYNKALKSTTEAMNIAKSIAYPREIGDAALNYTYIYKKLGNYKLALENYELFINMRDSINNIEAQKTSIRAQAQYEYEKKKAVEDEKHAAEIKVQEEKAQADKKRQNIIIGSVSVVLLLVAIFSILLYNRFKTTQKQKQIIEVKEKETQAQKHIIEEKQKEILDSINYAKRIQYTLLAHTDFLKENIPNHFVYFNPKDIVSGDFYWATSTGSGTNRKFYLAVCDSTGHGVPGAFMSLLNISFLNEAVNEKGIQEPNKVFDFVRQRLIDNISKEGQKDGFDGILICIETLPSPGGEGPGVRSKITYAAANNAPVLIKAALRQAQGPDAEPVEVPELIELNADRMPVGMGERKEEFKLYNIEANPGDTLYLYTDGYADQFGGPKGKKFKYKQLNELLISLHTKPLNEQHTELRSTFENWKGNLEQVDDVCMIGIKL